MQHVFWCPWAFPWKKNLWQAESNWEKKSKAQQLNVFSPAILCASTSFYCSPCPMQRLPPYGLAAAASFLAFTSSPVLAKISSLFLCQALLVVFFPVLFQFFFHFWSLFISPFGLAPTTLWAWGFSTGLGHRFFHTLFSFGQQAVS